MSTSDIKVRSIKDRRIIRLGGRSTIHLGSKHPSSQLEAPWLTGFTLSLLLSLSPHSAWGRGELV